MPDPIILPADHPILRAGFSAMDVSRLLTSLGERFLPSGGHSLGANSRTQAALLYREEVRRQLTTRYGEQIAWLQRHLDQLDDVVVSRGLSGQYSKLTEVQKDKLRRVAEALSIGVPQAFLSVVKQSTGQLTFQQQTYEYQGKPPNLIPHPVYGLEDPRPTIAGGWHPAGAVRTGQQNPLEPVVFRGSPSRRGQLLQAALDPGLGLAGTGVWTRSRLAELAGLPQEQRLAALDREAERLGARVEADAERLARLGRLIDERQRHLWALSELFVRTSGRSAPLTEGDVHRLRHGPDRDSLTSRQLVKLYDATGETARLLQGLYSQHDALAEQHQSLRMRLDDVLQTRADVAGYGPGGVANVRRFVESGRSGDPTRPQDYRLRYGKYQGVPLSEVPVGTLVHIASGGWRSRRETLSRTDWDKTPMTMAREVVFTRRAGLDVKEEGGRLRYSRFQGVVDIINTYLESPEGQARLRQAYESEPLEPLKGVETKEHVSERDEARSKRRQSGHVALQLGGRSALGVSPARRALEDAVRRDVRARLSWDARLQRALNDGTPDWVVLRDLPRYGGAVEKLRRRVGEKGAEFEAEAMAAQGRRYKPPEDRLADMLEAARRRHAERRARREEDREVRRVLLLRDGLTPEQAESALNRMDQETDYSKRESWEDWRGGREGIHPRWSGPDAFTDHASDQEYETLRKMKKRQRFESRREEDEYHRRVLNSGAYDRLKWLYFMEDPGDPDTRDALSRAIAFAESYASRSKLIDDIPGDDAAAVEARRRARMGLAREELELVSAVGTGAAVDAAMARMHTARARLLSQPTGDPGGVGEPDRPKSFGTWRAVRADWRSLGADPDPESFNPKAYRRFDSLAERIGGASSAEELEMLRKEVYHTFHELDTPEQRRLSGYEADDVFRMEHPETGEAMAFDPRHGSPLVQELHDLIRERMAAVAPGGLEPVDPWDQDLDPAAASPEELHNRALRDFPWLQKRDPYEQKSLDEPVPDDADVRRGYLKDPDRRRPERRRPEGGDVMEG